MWQLHFALALILTLGVSGEGDTVCFTNGECQDGIEISQSLTLGENSCLNFCQNVDGCNWFTYNTKSSMCSALSTCPQVVTEECPECLSGQVECPELDNKCLVKGLCKGTMIHETYESSIEKCSDLCKTYAGCAWFTFDAFPSVCLLFKDCPTLDESFGSCSSSSSLCKAKTSFTKLLVGVGETKSGNTNEVEIIDLESSLSYCSNLDNFPQPTLWGIGGLEFNDNPIICGGRRSYDNYTRECYSWRESAWEKSFSLNLRTGQAAFCQSPFPKESHKLIVAGGYGGAGEYEYSAVKVLTKDGWTYGAPDLPMISMQNCMVLLSSTIAFFIGGRQEEYPYEEETFYFDSADKYQNWKRGPSLNFGRDDHSCGRIKTNSSSNQFSVIVVGGFNYTEMVSVEILDEGASEWRNGPDLPFGITEAALVEDPAGGIILVGGKSTDDEYLQTLFRLSDAGEDAKWIEMPQKLKSGRNGHNAFLVPSDVASCSMKIAN